MTKQKEQNQENQKSRKENGWIKFLRVLIYAVSISGACIGAGLMKSKVTSADYANGVFAAKMQNGGIIFFFSLFILCANIMWGVLRWFLRGYREHWTAGRIIGKLIGGGLWRTVAITPLVIFSLLFLVPQISKTIARNIETAPTLEPLVLSERQDRLKTLYENLDNMDPSEAKAEFEKLFYCNFDFDTDASSNVATTNSWFFKNASAYSHTVTILNKAKLSSAGNFVVFYTDTGDDKISDSTAEAIGDMLETIIQNYKTTYGFEYKYNRLISNVGTSPKMRRVLRDSGMDYDVTETAMPVYVVEPYEEGSNTLASYAGKIWMELGIQIMLKLNGLLGGDEQGMLYDTSPSYPFIYITPNNAESGDLPIVAAHELGHHYVSTYNYEGSNSSESDGKFISETIANWLASNVLPFQPKESFINRHYKSTYLEDCHVDKISKACEYYEGYPATPFLESYYQVVPDATKIIMDATRNDALPYLYEQAGPDLYSKVMIDLAERTLTRDYGGKLISDALPAGEEIICDKLCEENFTINPSSTNYVYFYTEQYKDTLLMFDGLSNVHASILGRRRSDQWFEVIDSDKLATTFTITEEIVEKYESIAFAIASPLIDEESYYIIKVMPKEVEDIFITASKFNFSNLYAELEPGCYALNTDSIFDNVANLFDLGGNTMSLFEALDPDEMSGIREGYDAGMESARSGVAEAKKGLSAYNVSVCATSIELDHDFETTKKRIKKVIDTSIEVYDGEIGSNRISSFIGFDLLTQSAKVYVLAAQNDEAGLITVELSPK